MVKSKQNDLVEQEKLSILDIFLTNAVFDRWSDTNLKKSAHACGFDNGYLGLLFPNGVNDLTLFFHKRTNDQMIANFNPSLHNKISEKIANLIELKFSLYAPHKEAIRSLLKYNLMPQNLCQAQSLLWDTCSEIWYLAGDQSTDYNYYTKRTILAAIYSSSLLYWLSDESENHMDTKAYIKRKIKASGKFAQWKESFFRFFKNI